jgi:copper chaperone CopZ
VEGIQDFKVEAPPKDQAFIVFDPQRIDLDKIQKAITDTGYDVKNIVEIES